MSAAARGAPSGPYSSLTIGPPAAAWRHPLEEKQPERALRLMRISAAAEAAGDKHPVTPGGVVPMRELLGEMLLRLDHPGPAFAEFERSRASPTGSAASMAQRSQPKLRTQAW